MLKRMLVFWFFVPCFAQGQETRFGGLLEKPDQAHNHSSVNGFSSRGDISKEEGASFRVPLNYKFAYGWESVRLLPVERVKKALEMGLRERQLLFPDERLEFIKEAWEEVKLRHATRHLFAMDKFGRICLIQDVGRCSIIAWVSPKGTWHKLGVFFAKKVALPAAQALGLSLVYTPVLRAVGGGVAVGVGGTGGSVGCHQDGAAIHCGAH
ncbi:MAG: hypothetical protein JNN11_00760 [Candidatus Doudnabacteria bacterium]|nr:hypothetical protein [Candidatus Doudnabacteria bacterium]